MSKVPQLYFTNFTSSGNLSSDVNKSINDRTVDPIKYEGITFVMFYSTPCCLQEINVFNEIHNNINTMNTLVPMHFYIYQVNKGTNSAINSLPNAPYRIMGYPYIVTFYNGTFCSVYKPDDIPEPHLLANDIINYGNKITTKSICNMMK